MAVFRITVGGSGSSGGFDEAKHPRARGKFADKGFTEREARASKPRPPKREAPPERAPRAEAVARRAAATTQTAVGRSKTNGHPAEAALRAHELQIVDRPKERAIVFDKRGKALFKADGDKWGVEINARQVLASRDQTFTHNHPNGMSFSHDDLHLARVANLSEIRAVGRPTGGELEGQSVLYRMARPSGGWPSQAAVSRAKDGGHYDTVALTRLRPLVTSGRLSAPDAEAEHQHLLMAAWAKDHGVTYERIPLE